MNADGSGQTRMTRPPAGLPLDAYSNRDPAWSPDGTRIAFSSFRDQWTTGVYVMSMDGVVTKVSRGNMDTDFHPSWSPDGSKIVFWSTGADTHIDGDICVMNADGSGRTILQPLEMGDPAGDPAWSPDGSRIAFVVRGISVMNPDGTGLESPLSIGADPAWSPDSSRVAFTCGYDICVKNADGSGDVVRLSTDTSADRRDTHPAWWGTAGAEPTPAGGSVAGAGWIRSPPGAYAANPKMTGRMSFDLVSKTRDGTTVPVGQTQFRFQAADLTFRSTRYERLAIAGATARYTGTGTVNGKGGYGFAVTAVDGRAAGPGKPDRLRLRIWRASTGAIVYDNQRGAADAADPVTILGGGSIVVRRR